MKIKLSIKNRFTGDIIFEYEKEDNTIRDTVLEAIKRCANLSSADLRSADLNFANLRSANLRSANLSCANLSCANLSYANLSCADLSSAKLRYADLSYADLSSANLRSADLSYAKNAEYAIATTRICAEAHIIGYKKAKDSDGNTVIVELLIQSTAKRNNAFGRKCRAEYATVMEINKLDGTPVKEARSSHDSSFKYEIGDTIKPTKPYDEDFQNECSSGIHFFITKLEAINY